MLGFIHVPQCMFLPKCTRKEQKYTHRRKHKYEVLLYYRRECMYLYRAVIGRELGKRSKTVLCMLAVPCYSFQLNGILEIKCCQFSCLSAGYFSKKTKPRAQFILYFLFFNNSKQTVLSHFYLLSFLVSPFHIFIFFLKKIAV